VLTVVPHQHSTELFHAVTLAFLLRKLADIHFGDVTLNFAAL